MEEKIKKVMASVFGIDEGDITDTTMPDNLEMWDSLKHMSLIVALEEEFKVSFSDEEIGDMISYPLIKLHVCEKLGTNE